MYQCVGYIIPGAFNADGRLDALNEPRRTRLILRLNSIRYMDDVRYGNALDGKQVTERGCITHQLSGD